MTRVAAIFVALVVLFVLIRHGEVGLWDWDTYARIQFIHEYDAETYADGHLLYHGVMRALMAIGFTDLGAVVVETAIGMAAFYALLAWICRGLSRRMTALVFVAATLGSPGLVALFLMVEDNVLYFPVVLAIFYVQHRGIGRGVVLGVLLGVAMLINISLLVLVLALVPSAAILAFRDRRRALAILVAIATALAIYYLPHLGGAKIALHEFLPQALGLQDFGPSTAPLVSFDRFELWRGGLRSMALTPTLHQMVVPNALRFTLLSVMPWLLAACGVTLAVVSVRDMWRGALARIDLVATLAVSVVFPYFYEPFSIERWDVFWIGALFVLTLVLRKPARLVLALVGALIAMQALGTLVAIAHHYGKFSDPVVVQSRVVAREMVEHGGDVVVLPFSIDRVVLADFLFRIGGPPHVFLVRGDGSCLRVVFLGEFPVDRGEVQAAVRTAHHPYVDPAVKL